jgi:hypothetical protein
VEKTPPLDAAGLASIENESIEPQAGNGQNGNGEPASLRVSTQLKAPRRLKPSHPTIDKVLTMTQESDLSGHSSKEPKPGDNVPRP